ncbi:MAG: hypothetical protein BEN18_07720 [Epulopiscium sp. Nuni2H_MBin001]|nr:MAG: hypothetical protein BEN18_07720 [Epulopiscium sp. Nuni2H_MBin001]
MSLRTKYRQEFVVDFSEIDCRLEIKPSSLIGYMQQVTENHARTLNVAFSQAGESLFWVVGRTKLVIYKYPCWKSKVIIETFPTGVDKMFMMRSYRIYDEKYDLLAEIIGCFLLVDENTNKPIRPTNMSTTLSSILFEYRGEKLDKIKSGGELIRSENRKVRYNELDINRHMNNCYHFNWTVDMFSSIELAARPIKSIQLNYVTAVKEGSIVIVRLFKKSNDTFYVEGISNDEKPIIYWQSTLTR